MALELAASLCSDAPPPTAHALLRECGVQRMRVAGGHEGGANPLATNVVLRSEVQRTLVTALAGKYLRMWNATIRRRIARGHGGEVFFEPPPPLSAQAATFVLEAETAAAAAAIDRATAATDGAADIDADDADAAAGKRQSRGGGGRAGTAPPPPPYSPPVSTPVVTARARACGATVTHVRLARRACDAALDEIRRELQPNATLEVGVETWHRLTAGVTRDRAGCRVVLNRVAARPVRPTGGLEP